MSTNIENISILGEPLTGHIHVFPPPEFFSKTTSIYAYYNESQNPVIINKY